MNFDLRPNSDIWNTLDRIKSSIGADDSGLRDLMKLGHEQYELLRRKRGAPPVTAIFALLEQLHLSFDNLMAGNVDYGALRQAWKSEAAVLPERYAVGAFSRRRTSINVLAYIENHFGWHKKDELLRHFQVDEEIFDDPDEWISLRFLTELTELLGRIGFSEQAFVDMGRYSVVTNRNTRINRKMASYGSCRKMYLSAFENMMPDYDENFDYAVTRAEDSSLTFRVTPRARLIDALKETRPGNSRICLIRGAVAGSFPEYLGLPMAKIEKSSCIHQGDSNCRYELDFSRAREQEFSCV